MQNHKFYLLTEAIILLFLGMHLSGCARYITAWYTPSDAPSSPGYLFSLHGKQNALRHRTFFSLASYVTRPNSSDLPSGTGIALWGRSYPLASLTTTTLASLGFSVQRQSPFVPVCPPLYLAYLEKGSCIVIFHLKGNRILQFYHSSKSGPSPVGFTFGSSREARFPLSQKQMKNIFGKPHKIEYGTSPGLRSFLIRIGVLRVIQD